MILLPMGKRFPLALPLLAALSILCAPAAANQSAADYQALRKEMDLMRERLAALQKEVNELKAQRAAQPAPGAKPAPSPAVVPVDNLVLNLAKAPIRGSESARVALVEVSDFECPFCARYSAQTSGQVVREFVQTGKIRYAFVHLPIASHRNAFKAAEAAMCAGEQGKFWEMRDQLFVNQKTALARPRLPENATAIGIRVDAFNSCLDSARHAPLVQSDMAMVSKLGVRATPTFFIGTIDPKTRSFTATHRIVGAKNFSVFKGALESALAGAPAPAP
jgi:protein-disulfide isomerase